MYSVADGCSSCQASTKPLRLITVDRASLELGYVNRLVDVVSRAGYLVKLKLPPEIRGQSLKSLVNAKHSSKKVASSVFGA